jgi:hypothetical protein
LSTGQTSILGRSKNLSKSQQTQQSLHLWGLSLVNIYVL